MTDPAGMATEPAVSVIVPVRDGAAYLDEALASVAAQGVDGVEVLVVDDGSSDDSAARAARHPDVTVLSASPPGAAPAGPAAARNLGLARSTGRHLAFLDADDRWPAGRLALMLDHLAAHPRCGVVVGRQAVVLEAGVARPAWIDEPADWIPFGARSGLGPQVPPLSLVARREVFDAVGDFAPDLLVCEDLDWFVRATELGVQVDIVETVVVERRIHGANLSHDREAMNRGALAVLARKMQRARRLNP